MQSRTRLQGRWNGIFSLESRAGLNNKAGRMDFSLSIEQNWITRHVEWNFSWRVTQDWTMQVEWRWNAGGMELSLRCCQEWITMPVEWIFLGLSRRIG